MPEKRIDITISIPKSAYEALLESFEGTEDEKKLNLHSAIKVNGLNGAKIHAARYHGEKIAEKIKAKDFAGCDAPSAKKDLVEQVTEMAEFNGEAEIRASLKAKRLAVEAERKKQVESEIKARKKKEKPS